MSTQQEPKPTSDASKPSSEPTVSVVMPIGRVDDDLPFQLEALGGQSYTGPWELVLSLNSDDPAQRRALEGSVERLTTTADSPSVADRPGENGAIALDRVTVKIVDSSAMRSASHARNVGAAEASGELLLFCDGDDIADLDWMTAMISALGEARVVGGFLEEELLAVPGQEGWRPPATPGALPAFLGFPYLVSANMGIHRSDFEAVGGFDTSLIRGEDIAFSWDLIERGLELAYAPDAVMHYRHRQGMWPMMKQHYLYGRGFSQILARRGTPGSSEGATGLKALKPNNQSVDAMSLAYFARRGSIAAGRVVGLVKER
ncbi:MAG: glycosyltransferase [Acidimicrobiales bacterium]